MSQQRIDKANERIIAALKALNVHTGDLPVDDPANLVERLADALEKLVSEKKGSRKRNSD